MAVRFPVSKNLIKYNNNNLEENYEAEKNEIDIEFTDQNTYPEYNDYAIDLRW